MLTWQIKSLLTISSVREPPRGGGPSLHFIPADLLPERMALEHKAYVKLCSVSRTDGQEGMRTRAHAAAGIRLISGRVEERASESGRGAAILAGWSMLWELVGC